MKNLFIFFIFFLLTGCAGMEGVQLVLSDPPRGYEKERVIVYLDLEKSPNYGNCKVAAVFDGDRFVEQGQYNTDLSKKLNSKLKISRAGYRPFSPAQLWLQSDTKYRFSVLLENKAGQKVIKPVRFRTRAMRAGDKNSQSITAAVVMDWNICGNKGRRGYHHPHYPY